MITLLRTFIVWLLLLALPCQGYAAASMMLCAMAAPASVTAYAAGTAAPHHDHAAMLAAQVPEQHEHEHHEHRTSNHDGVKCGTGSPCCVGAALTPAPALALPALDVESSAIPFFADFLPAVHLAHPERPPQALRA